MVDGSDISHKKVLDIFRFSDTEPDVDTIENWEKVPEKLKDKDYDVLILDPEIGSQGTQKELEFFKRLEENRYSVPLGICCSEGLKIPEGGYPKVKEKCYSKFMNDPKARLKEFIDRVMGIDIYYPPQFRINGIKDKFTSCKEKISFLLFFKN